MDIKEKITNARVLVTGGAGFIGSNLVEDLLKYDNDVICLDNFLTGKRENIQEFFSDNKFKLIEGDIRDREVCYQAVSGVDIVLHQAALGSVPRSINDPATSTDINIGGFVNMITAAKDAKVKRFVFASSSSVYGDSRELPKVEERIGKPLSPYAITKLANEIFAKNFSEVFGLETIGLRYFNVFGKKQDPEGPYAAVIPRFINKLLKGESPEIYGDGTQSRDFTYIDNVVKANHLAAISTNPDAVNQVYNIACGESTTLNELFETIRKTLAETNPDVEKIKPVFFEERNGDVRHSMASIVKAGINLFYQPSFDLNQGINKAIDWYLDQTNSSEK